MAKTKLHLCLMCGDENYVGLGKKLPYCNRCAVKIKEKLRTYRRYGHKARYCKECKERLHGHHWHKEYCEKHTYLIKEKECNGPCKQIKPIEEFTTFFNNKYKRMDSTPECKECRKRYYHRPGGRKERVVNDRDTLNDAHIVRVLRQTKSIYQAKSLNEILPEEINNKRSSILLKRAKKYYKENYETKNT
jgi:hypothetical protein